MAQGHYFDAEPAVPSRPTEVELVLPDFQARLQADRGVFSAGGVDPGTLELLRATRSEAALLGRGSHLLDLGCGYGPIACTLAHFSPGSTVWAVDVNDRALALTAGNARRLGFDAVHATRPEDVPPDRAFAAIWSNPPIRIGKAALQELLMAWLPRLEPAGAAWMVVSRHLGADSLASWLRTEGWRVDRRGSKRGYRILRVDRP
jgi:16S rRNA (guanine1207-N2)-methyltransferase